MERRILIVDDDAEVRDFLARALHGAGFRTHCAEDGEAGWNALRWGSFDALITDHEMPRLTGMDLLRRVRSVQRTVPVILTSGNMPWHDPDLARLLPPGIALQKPFTLAGLLAHLRGLLVPAEAVGPIPVR